MSLQCTFDLCIGANAMVLFIIGVITGGLLMAYLLLGADRWRRQGPRDATVDQAQRWQDQRPMPPF